VTTNPPVNNEPSIPSLQGSASADVNESIAFTASASDPEGEQVNIGFDWDSDGTMDDWSGFVPSGASVSVSHTFNTAGLYTVTAKAQDSSNNVSGAASAQISIQDVPSTPDNGGDNGGNGGGGNNGGTPVSNSAPAISSVTGPDSGSTGISYDFVATGTDVDNDQINYGFDWDSDGTMDDWSGFVASGASASVSHIFNQNGDYTITVKAQDPWSNVSGAFTKTISVQAPTQTVDITTATLTPSASCVAVGTSASFTVTVAGTGITSIVLEKDTNADGVFGQAASWNTPGTFTFTTSESADYAGTFTARLLVNGTNVDQKDVTFSTNCAGGGNDGGGNNGGGGNDGGGNDGGGNNGSNNPTGHFTINAAGGLTTSENGATAVFTVVLDSAPLADVTFAVVSNDPSEGSVDPLKTTLVFKPSDWNVTQTVTITGVDDAIVDGNIAYSISVGPSASADVNWNGITAQTVTITNIDNESGGTVVVPLSATLSTTAGSCVAVSTDMPFTVTVTGTEAGTVTLEKDTNNDGIFGQVGSWTSAGTFTFTGNEGSSYTGTYAIRLLLNGTVVDTKTITVSSDCSNSGNNGGNNGGGGPLPSNSGHGGGSGSSGGPCIGYGCTTATVPSGSNGGTGGGIIIIPDQPVSTGGGAVITGPEKVCPSGNLLNAFLRIGIDNNPEQVRILQHFLNTSEGAQIAEDGIFGTSTEAAVKVLQSRHSEEILAPWGVTEATGIVYITTTRYINTVTCGQGTSTDTNIKDNSDDFNGAIGQATSTSALGNLAGALGAFTGRVLRALGDIPWYPLLILLLLLLGAGYTIRGAFIKDILSRGAYLAVMKGMALLAIGSVLNVLNTLSFIINPNWITDKAGLSLSWLLFLDMANAIVVIGICVAILFALYRKVAAPEGISTK
jgi:PKD domain./Putative peptidoglycan binding domain.